MQADDGMGLYCIAQAFHTHYSFVMIQKIANVA